MKPLNQPQASKLQAFAVQAHPQRIGPNLYCLLLRSNRSSITPLQNSKVATRDQIKQHCRNILRSVVESLEKFPNAEALLAVLDKV